MTELGGEAAYAADAKAAGIGAGWLGVARVEDGFTPLAEASARPGVGQDSGVVDGVGTVAGLFICRSLGLVAGQLSPLARGGVGRTPWGRLACEGSHARTARTNGAPCRAAPPLGEGGGPCGSGFVLFGAPVKVPPVGAWDSGPRYRNCPLKVTALAVP